MYVCASNQNGSFWDSPLLWGSHACPHGVAPWDSTHYYLLLKVYSLDTIIIVHDIYKISKYTLM